MAQAQLDLISMADIARLAGQSRATVGNWKSRNPEDFPPERGRGPRGPLYDRAEVTAWLEATNRLDKRPPEVAAMWHLADQLRGEMSTEDAMPLLLLLLAVMSKSPGSDWQRMLDAQPSDLDATLRPSLIALSLSPMRSCRRACSRPSRSPESIATLSSLDRPGVGVMADALLEQAANHWVTVAASFSLRRRCGGSSSPSPSRPALSTTLLPASDS